MKRSSTKPTKKRNPSPVIRRIERDIQKLSDKTERSFDQLVVTSAASLKLTLKEISSLRKRIERLERKVRTRK